jgi:hypothetical protein
MEQAVPQLLELGNNAWELTDNDCYDSEICLVGLMLTNVMLLVMQDLEHQLARTFLVKTL